MLDAFYVGATGMQAQQAHVDAIANNLANISTPGFKKTRVSFSDLVVTAATGLAADDGSAAPTAAGAGVQLLAASQVFETGDLAKTGAPMDLAIAGEGFIELAMPDGSRAYTRGGTLKVNADGQLATQSGLPLKPGISIPTDADGVDISAAGRVQVRLPGQATPVDVGQLELVRFTNPQGLLPQGSNVYRATDASGEPIAGRAGEDGMGSLAQGMLEGSNVKLVDEMVNLVVAQRAYEANAKVVQAADEMLGIINGLRR